MIINKIYEVNYVNMDSVITAMAKDIEEGYTLYKVEQLPFEASIGTINLKPAMVFTMHNKKADLDSKRAGWL